MEGVRLGGKWRERSRGKKKRGRWRAMCVVLSGLLVVIVYLFVLSWIS
jgi:hypothetical protein